MLKNRFLCQVLIAFISGAFVSTLIVATANISVIILAISGFSFAFSFILLKKKIISTKVFFLSLLILMLVFSYSVSSVHIKLKYSDNQITEKEVTIEALILDANSRYTEIKVTDGALDKGTKIRIYDLEKANENIISEPFYNGTFSITISQCPNYIKAESISYYGVGKIINSHESDGNHILKIAYKLRSFLCEKVEKTFKESEISASFIKAIILGDTSGISDKMYFNYGRLGITHIISVSGLHFTLIIMSLYKLIQYFRVNIILRSVICIPIAIFYCLLTGASPSAVRSLIMIIVVLIVRSFLSSHDMLTSLTVAAALIIGSNPYSFFSTSFVLSFLATLAICLSPSFFRTDRQKLKNKNFLRVNNIVQSLFVTLIISMFISPTLYNRFQTISIITPLANLLLSKVFNLLMYFSITGVFLSLLPHSGFIVSFISKFIETFYILIEKIASIKGISMVPSKPLNIIILFLLIICVLSAFFLKKKPRENIIKMTVVIFLVSVMINSFIVTYTRKNYQQIFFNETARASIIISQGNVYFLAENENEIDIDFAFSHNALDIDGVIIKNIKNIKNPQKAINKINAASNSLKIDKIYCSLSEKDETDNILSFDLIPSELINATEQYGIDILYKAEQNILWLGDNAKGYSKNENVDIVVFSESFFKNNSNLISLPYNVKEFYIPENSENTYIANMLKRNNPDADFYFIKDFRYKTKNM